MGSAFEALKGGRIMPDPSLLVTIPSLDDPTTVPTGCSTLYVLEPVPHLDGKINWSTEAKPLRGRLHTFLATQGYPSEVITEQLVTPLDLRMVLISGRLAASRVATYLRKDAR
jgi:phytoene desaturase